MKKLLLMTGALLLSLSAYAGGKKDCAPKSFADVTPAQMKEYVANKSATIVDVNGKSSFDKKKIGKAIHFASVKDTFAASLPKDKAAPIVTYCGGKLCTAWQKAAVAACKLGYTNVKHFSPGIKGWNG